MRKVTYFTCMDSYLVGVDALNADWAFIYTIRCVCEQWAVKALAILRTRTGTSE